MQIRIARPAVLEVSQPGEVLPGGRLAPALDDTLVALVVGVLQVQQRDHQAQWHPGPTGRGDAATDHARDRAEQILVFDLLARAYLLGEGVGNGGFDLLPGHARGQHGERVAQIDRPRHRSGPKWAGPRPGRRHIVRAQGWLDSAQPRQARTPSPPCGRTSAGSTPPFPLRTNSASA